MFLLVSACSLRVLACSCVFVRVLRVFGRFGAFSMDTSHTGTMACTAGYDAPERAKVGRQRPANMFKAAQGRQGTWDSFSIGTVLMCTLLRAPTIHSAFLCDEKGDCVGWDEWRLCADCQRATKCAKFHDMLMERLGLAAGSSQVLNCLRRLVLDMLSGKWNERPLPSEAATRLRLALRA